MKFINMTNLIEIKDLSKSFRQSLFEKKEVLKQINFTLKSHEFIVLKGANGSGKTTLINLILGLSKPDKGKIKLFGKSPQDYRSKIKLGVVLQKVSIPKNLKVIELVSLFRQYYPNPLSIDEIFNTVNLKGKEKNWASKLSGGEEQRLYFALALSGNPELLILDEPTRNLDEEGFKEFWQQIDNCWQKNISILMVTNQQSDLPYLQKFGTKYISLNNGQLEQIIVS